MKFNVLRSLVSLRPVVLVLSVALVFSSCKKDDPAPGPGSIASIVSNDANFSLLKAAITRAGLTSALESGSLTVFAPDNAAFAAAGVDLALINSIPVADLTAVLTYHVVGAKVPSSAVPVSDTVNTLQGENIYASKNANGVFVNGIKVKSADIQASNGVIHVISDVLFPPTETIAEILSSDPSLSILLAAASQVPAILTAATSPGKLTVFAPDDDAFSTLATPPTTAQLPGILQSHILGTNVFSSDLINGATVPTLNSSFSILVGTTPSATVKLNGSTQPASNIIEADIIATNGVVHVIDRVLLP